MISVEQETPEKQTASAMEHKRRTNQTFPSPAVQLLDLKVRVEVEDDALRRLGGRDDPAAVLIGRILVRVAGGGDVSGVAGVQVAAARLRRWKETEVGENAAFS